MIRSVLAAPAHRGAALLQGGMGVLAPLISLARRLSGHLPFDPQITNPERHLLTCGLSQPLLDDLSADNAPMRAMRPVPGARGWRCPLAFQRHVPCSMTSDAMPGGRA